MIGAGYVVPGYDGCEIQIEQVRCTVGRGRLSRSESQRRIDLCPDIGERHAGCEIPRTCVDVPHLEQRRKSECDLSVDAERRLARDRHLSIGTDRAVKVYLAEAYRGDRFR